MYILGVGGRPNSPFAVRLFRKGCENGDAASCGMFTAAVLIGQGSSEDWGWVRAFAAKGCAAGDAQSCKLMNKIPRTKGDARVGR
jgi:TPR repeat protein